jgi:hypothetical protein
MSFTTMYDGKVNSPATGLDGGITDSDTTISLTDASVLPDAPNLAVIGTGESAETILYTGKSSNDLTGVTRGFQGSAAAWSTGTAVSRFFTEHDYDALKTNLEKVLENNKENLIIDSNFSYWPETTTETNPTTGDYVHVLSQVVHAKSSGTRPTITISRQALTAGEENKSFYVNRCAASAADSSLDAGSYYVWIRHYIHQGARHLANGEKITVRIRLKSSVAGQKIGICARQNFGTGGSPSAEIDLAGEIHELTNSFADYDTTITSNSNTGKTFGTNNDDYVAIDVLVQAGSTIASSLFSRSAFGFTEAVNIDCSEFHAYRGEEAYEFVFSDDEFEIGKFFEVFGANVVAPFVALSGSNDIYSYWLYQKKIQVPNIIFGGVANTDHVIRSGSGALQSGFSFDTVDDNLFSAFIKATKTSHGLSSGYFQTRSNGYLIADARY